MPKSSEKSPRTPLVAKAPPQESPPASPAKPTTRVVDLVGRVATALGQPGKDVRAIVTATLAELGTALDKGEVLHLPPFGKVRVNRSKTVGAAQMMTLKLRRGGGEKAGKGGLVDEDEAG